MRFASIATILRDETADADVLRAAISASRHLGAHLSVYCTASAPGAPGLFYTGTQAVAVHQEVAINAEASTALRTFAREALADHSMSWDVDCVSLCGGGLNEVLGQKLRFHDLVVLPLPYATGRRAQDVVNFEAGLFDARTPILLTPKGAALDEAPRTVLVAWDNSEQALAAARAALPMIVGAKRTYIHVIEPPYHGIDRSDPGGRLAEVFARAGAEVDITVSPRKGPNTGRQLLAQAEKVGADLMVMGGYGHSRLQEAVLGGATRTMLHEATLPVLMAR
ncbi:MAG: universal stress protein [Silicimonas sp.]|nr:universal stress protein [Silicimonas sp.]